MYLSTYFWNFCILGKSFWRPATLYDTCPKSTSSREAMAPHSSTLAWKIPGMGEPGGLPSMGSHRVRLDRSDLAAAAAALQASVSATLPAVLRLSLHLPCVSRCLLPTSSQAHQHLRNLFGLFLINSLTNGPPVKCRYSSFMFTAARDSHAVGREQAQAPPPSDPPFWVERS